ncbi:MAG: NAD(+) diphosphatase [Alkalispirochaetaceae bacterium]
MPAKPVCIGRLAGVRYLAVLLDESSGTEAVKLPPGRWVNRRSAARELGGGEYWITARGYELARWDRESRYCGRCGAGNLPTPGETGKVCESCGHREYPRITPAMIVAVVNDGRLLMAHAHKHRKGLFSVLAGFVEPGESLEACVHREVAEETGVTLSTVHYFGSQSWPFPYSLMVAFTAEAETEEIRLEDDEIGEAGWYTPEQILSIPEIPERLTVARALIDWFVDSYGNEATRRTHHQRP